jgi:hypothetical protein
VLVRHILDLNARGFAPTLAAVRDIADRLLAEKGASQVGKIWPYNFVKRIPELKTRFTQQQDRQRVLCENPELIKSWFKLV